MQHSLYNYKEKDLTYIYHYRISVESSTKYNPFFFSTQIHFCIKQIILFLAFFFSLSFVATAQDSTAQKANPAYTLIDFFERSDENNKPIFDVYLYQQSRFKKKGLGFSVSASVVNNGFARFAVIPTKKVGKSLTLGGIAGFNTSGHGVLGYQAFFQNKYLTLFGTHEFSWEQVGDYPSNWWWYGYGFHKFNMGNHCTLQVGGVIRKDYGTGPLVGFELLPGVSMNLVWFWEQD